MNIDKIIESLNGVYTESNIRKVLAEEVSNEKSDEKVKFSITNTNINTTVDDLLKAYISVPI